MASKAELRDKVRRLRRKLKKLERSKLKRKLNTARADLADMSDLIDEQHRDHQEIVANLHSHIDAMKTTIGDLGRDRDNAVRASQLDSAQLQAFRSWQMTGTSASRNPVAEVELRKEREEHEVTKGVCYSILRALGHDTISVRHRGLSLEHRERLIAAAARIRNFEVMLGKAIHAYANVVNKKHDECERQQAIGVVDGLHVAASLYKGTERTLEAPPVTNTYLDTGFWPQDLETILEMTGCYQPADDNPGSRHNQLHMLLRGISNHADLKADFVRCVNDLVGDLRRQHATEISPPPPKAN